MNADSIKTDVRYALGQLRRAGKASGHAARDCMSRALDALERVGAELEDRAAIDWRPGELCGLPTWTAEEILRNEG